MSEPEIIINGINVGPGCAMTIRVALQIFADNLRMGEGDEDFGKSMTQSYLDLTQSYLDRIDDIRRIMRQNDGE